MSESPPARPPNRLIHETSPYLLQHAYNPVDWFPWGDAALALAKEQDKPILLSIGYSACHWCHVMERESFENESIAALMNASFVCIKVDREERPDLDEIYMQATLAMNQGHGGWPMTVFLTPDQEPIFAGTYFPPTDKWGRPGFATVLQKIAEGWATDRAEIVDSASRFTTRLQTSMRAPTPTTVGQPEIEAAVQQFSGDFDPVYGGFGQAPKFPPAVGLSFLLRQYHRSRSEQVLHMACHTLDAMAAGGMYDHIGGGFARYSTDERWLVPHFEKMLYDNALLAKTYLEAFQVTGSLRYQRVTREILDYILREMTAPEGGYYSATDADSEGVEGKFFVWDPDQVLAVAPSEEDATRFCAYYDITADGNWEHHSIPHTPRSLERVAEDLHCSPEALQETIDRVKPLLYQARLQRVPPGLDDKIITAWNGMMISAMAEAARVLGHASYLDSASRAADFLLTTLSRPDGGLYRTYRADKAHLPAYLEDYAYLIEALIDLYEAGGRVRYLTEAVRLGERLLTDFLDETQGGFFTTANDHETLILRGREGPDGATPSGNAVAAMALARLSFHQDREDFREAATQAVRAYGQQISRVPRGFAKTLMAADFLLNGPLELAFIGSPGDPGYDELVQEAARHFLPHRIIGHADTSDSSHPLLRGKARVNERAALYVCRNFTCQAPITDPADIARALTTLLPGETDSASHTLASTGISGAATASGTAAYVSRILARASGPTGDGYTTLGSTGLTNSRIGFGGYRIDVDQEEHRSALMQAIREGCNLIDTSTNYADGGSERLVGSVLKELITQKEIAREHIIVVSKIGYVQGRNFTQAQSKDQTGHPYPEMVKYGDGLWHCIHPEFLAEQLTLSLDRLGLATLDLCLLHNPEYFLSDAKRRNLSDEPSALDECRTEFYRRLEQAFVYLESQIDMGRIQYYGVSSNTCTAQPDDPEATSLSRMLDAAQAAARQTGKRDHGFRVLQLPMNLFESGALLTPNTGPEQQHTVLALAQAQHLGVLVNRPLNAMPGDRRGMIRLADPHVEPVTTSFETQQATVAALEEEFRKDFAPHVPYSGKGLEPKDFFALADELRRVRSQIHNLEHWDQMETQMLAPHVNQALQVVAKHLPREHATAWQSWQNRYIPKLLVLLKILRQEAAKKSQENLRSITAALDPLLPDDKRREPLSRKALWSVTSTPGVTCVLNGIRKAEYVADALTILRWPALPGSRSIFERLHSPSP